MVYTATLHMPGHETCHIPEIYRRAAPRVRTGIPTTKNTAARTSEPRARTQVADPNQPPSTWHLRNPPRTIYPTYSHPTEPQRHSNSTGGTELAVAGMGVHANMPLVQVQQAFADLCTQTLLLPIPHMTVTVLQVREPRGGGRVVTRIRLDPMTAGAVMAAKRRLPRGISIDVWRAPAELEYIRTLRHSTPLSAGAAQTWTRPPPPPPPRPTHPPQQQQQPQEPQHERQQPQRQKQQPRQRQRQQQQQQPGSTLPAQEMAVREQERIEAESLAEVAAGGSELQEGLNLWRHSLARGTARIIAGTELEEQLRRLSLAATGQLPAAAIQQAAEEGRTSVVLERRSARLAAKRGKNK